MKNIVRLLGAVSVLACAALVVPGQVSASISSSSAQDIAWLKNVQKVEKIVITVGQDLESVGIAKTRSAGLVAVRKAEKDNAKAISLHNSGPKASAKYASVDKLLGKSLQEYKSGLRTVDQGFVKNSNSLISKGLNVIKKGTADQNKVAKEIAQVSKSK